MGHAQERTAILLGDEGLQRLADSHVLIVGLGGVGGAVAEAIARAGVGRITVVDHDVIGISNMNRQLVCTHSVLGRKKAAVMAERLRDINPDANITAIPAFLRYDNIDAFLQQQAPDMVLDCIDSVACKALLVARCQQQGLAIASSMGAGGRLDVRQAQVSTLARTHHCGLAANLRRKLRRMGASLDYPVVFSTEPPIKPLPQAPVSDDPAVLPRAVNGTISYMPNLFGFMLAGIAIETLLTA